MKDLHTEMNDLYLELGIVQKEFCTQDENLSFKKISKDGEALPEDVHEVDIVFGTYCRYVKTDMSVEEIQELLLLRQTSYLKSIKRGVTFFVALAVVGLLLGLYIGYAGLI